MKSITVVVTLQVPDDFAPERVANIVEGLLEFGLNDVEGNPEDYTGTRLMGAEELANQAIVARLLDEADGSQRPLEPQTQPKGK